MKQVAIIDYDMGNMFSVEHALIHVGIDPLITADSEQIINSDAAILPGVGAFGEAMSNLNRLGLIDPIKAFIAAGKPFLGICLGMQLLFTKSDEFGDFSGLDIISGRVVRFPNQDADGKIIKVPQIGWNQIFPPNDLGKSHWKNTPLTGLETGEFMYFVHSYYAIPTDDQIILTVSDYYGSLYCSSLMMKNVTAMQYHPEKSGKEGLKIYQQWSSRI